MSREPEEVRIAAARGAVDGHLTKRSQALSIWEACKFLAFAQRMVRDGGCFKQRTEVCCGSQQVPLDG